MHSAVKSGYSFGQFMTALTTAGLVYSTEANVLKVAHSEPFSDESMKVRIFVLQMDNKIADAAEALKERKIRYKMSLLRGAATE